MRRPITLLPDLESYDIWEVSTSAGKDSLAQLSYVSRLARERGMLDRVVAVHADLGRVEWKGSREIAEAQARHLGARFMVVKRPQGDLLQHVEKLGKWPMPTQRFCTADHKRGQIYTAFTTLAAEVRRKWRSAFLGLGGHDRPMPRRLPTPPTMRPVRILNCIGLRAEESRGRAKRPALSRDPKPSGKNKIVDSWVVP